MALGVVDNDELVASEPPADVGRSDKGKRCKIVVVESLVIDLHRINLGLRLLKLYIPLRV